MNHTDRTVPNVLHRLAEALGTAIIDHVLVIPEQYGNGYCSGYVFNDHIRILICNYELKEDLLLRNPDIDTSKKMLLFKFQHIFQKHEAQIPGKQITPSVLIATSRVDTDDVIAIHTNTATVYIEVDAAYLKSMFGSSKKTPVLQGLIQNDQPLLFEQLLYIPLQKIVDEMISSMVSEAFKLFFLRVKAEELVCKLLMELEKRDETQVYALNNQDIQTLYKIRELILENLEAPPVINKLVVAAGMSPTKLKRLFKQVFGNSIYSYYQQFRMSEAARLLREEKLSVSEVGYRMGFTNLSHFSRVFQEHIGIKPKQYSRL